jgi:hypothetical protein
MTPPSERNQAIATRRAEGATFRAIADEFGLNPKRVKEIAQRVERYNRGTTILKTDPSSLDGLELIGRIPSLTRASLSAVGISRLEELDGMSLADLLRLTSPSVLIRLSAQNDYSSDILYGAPGEQHWQHPRQTQVASKRPAPAPHGSP